MNLTRVPGFKPQNNMQAVERYVLKNDIVLTSEQEELLQRLQYADELSRLRVHGREEIINLIKTRFGVSKWRADLDITEAHSLFGVTRKIKKNYLLGHHIDSIGEQIEIAKKARRLELLPKLNDNYTYALNSLPPETSDSEASPVKIVFVIKGGDKSKKSVDELLREADELIQTSTLKTDEYIDYEEQS